MNDRLVLYEIDSAIDILSDIVEVKRSRNLGHAPTIHKWITVKTGARVALWGQVTGHPERIEQDVMTSPLFYIDPETGFARTRSRWYWLDKPLRDENDLAHEAMVFGPDSVEVPLEEALSVTRTIPNLLLIEVEILGDEHRSERVREIQKQLLNY
ncbi:MAG: hypothetical protein JXQ85_02255 [Cognatishimia sp.]|uniref:DUF6634 family protein n=1 Tax=Cognatishimia sp. TaxID=2211648 RepID=UPI003B8C331E